LWTLKKAVTTLAIAPQSESLTRAGRMAYNLMIFKAQRMNCDEEGGYSAPLSEIIKGFGSTTRDSTRIRSYIEQMCSTVVRWFPLSRSDEAQATLVGIEAPTTIDPSVDGRIFTLLSEARFTRRSGEQWVTWFFPPTIRDMVIEPSRWAQLDIKEMAKLSHYASVALYEICARYKDVPGGLTNRAEPSFWAQTLRPDPDTKPREWRKFKNETLRPAVAEINQLTTLDIELIEERKGRAVVSVQFKVRRKETERAISSVDLSLVEQAAELGIKERDLDQLVEEYGEEKVKKALAATEGRRRAQPTVPIKHPVAYIRKSIRNGVVESLFDQSAAEASTARPAVAAGATDRGREDAWLAQRKHEINDALDELSITELERYAGIARESLATKGFLSASMQKRFDQKQYRAPMIWEYIRSAYAEEHFGADWKVPPLTAA
jgi:hypothetical protein